MKNRKIGKTIRKYVLIEVFALAVAAAILAIMLRITKTSIRADIEEQVSVLRSAAASTVRTDWDIWDIFSSEPAFAGDIDWGKKLSGLSGFEQYLWHNLFYEDDLEHQYYKGCVNVATYTALSDTYDAVGDTDHKMFFNDIVAMVGYQSSEKDVVVWDLTKYFPKEDILSIMDDAGSWWGDILISSYTLESLYVKETEEGLVPTRVTVVIAPRIGHYELQSADYSESDTRVWLMPDNSEWGSKESVSEGYASIFLCRQNEKLAALINDKDKWESLDEDSRYYKAELLFTKDSFTGHDQLMDGIRYARTTSNGRLEYDYYDSAPSTVAYLVVVDVTGVAWNKLNRTVWYTLALAQTLAIIAMILMTVTSRRREEEETLRNTFINAMAVELKAPVAATRETAYTQAFPISCKVSSDIYPDDEKGGNKSNLYRDDYVIRLAETYLIRAEAHMRAGDLASAARDINVVRARSKCKYLVTPDDVNVDLILDERARELIYEENRWNTLLRMGGTLASDRIREYSYWEYPRSGSMKNFGVWPIPQTVIDTNKDVKIEQNEGWK